MFFVGSVVVSTFLGCKRNGPVEYGTSSQHPKAALSGAQRILPQAEPLVVRAERRSPGLRHGQQSIGHRILSVQTSGSEIAKSVYTRRIRWQYCSTSVAVVSFVLRKFLFNMATRLQTDVVTRAQSLQILKHTLNLGVSSILYLRNCFEEDAFQPLQFQGLHLRQLKPVNAKAKRILGWLQDAVNDSLQQEYLEHLSLGIHCRTTDKLLECYQFHFTYTGDEAGVSVTVRKGNARAFEQVGSRLACVTKEEAKRQTELLLRSMCCLTQSLEHLPDEHYVSMTLAYNGKTPAEYKCEGFALTESPVTFGNDVPLDALTGEIRTGYHALTVRIQTVCDSEDTYFLEWETVDQKEDALKQHLKAYAVQTGITDCKELAEKLDLPVSVAEAAFAELQQQDIRFKERTDPPVNERLRSGVRPYKERRDSSSLAGDADEPARTENDRDNGKSLRDGIEARGEAAAVVETYDVIPLLRSSEELPKRYRHVTKDIIASSCAVSDAVGKELLKHLIQQGLVKARPSRGRGHESTVYASPAGRMLKTDLAARKRQTVSNKKEQPIRVGMLSRKKRTKCSRP
ncbi:HORMA domain-containing protein [Toxoplasma gondii GAB2-2007-GAL-DOM2]|uniref:HORMA domain-containing protein n=5 Tax=Toxoplasma gondii TaxID=5811 RepID=S7UPX4_TOXGG|nr:HORMA domain-containing protein [Toxoplasma gondii GT1]KAF4644581.1 HORMA domain-containing protein [Toxoplasma gondii]KFG41659.1 HORMA domain-containing protein [Toxoplasma gondii FOU]KFG42152.1 HORMA domain-containing protein [Toxoplasma gondii GAB2-2007-GAL-DOM2]RQX73567.1 HORMA domain-containing protein [Toxoplasma gondii CAST]